MADEIVNMATRIDALEDEIDTLRLENNQIPTLKEVIKIQEKDVKK